MTRKTHILCVLDGWGYRENPQDNGIAMSHTPAYDRFLKVYPFTLLDASSRAVGLPEGQMGNSEVGHMHLGAGRVIMQDLCRIDDAIANATLSSMPALDTFVEKMKKTRGKVHVVGMLSDGGIHSHINHMMAVLNILTSHGIDIAVHASLDGRDTPPQSATEYLKIFDHHGFNDLIKTLMGRFYAMDRDNRWDRTQAAYDAITLGKGQTFTKPYDAVIASYSRDGKTDEFMTPWVHHDYKGMNDGDGLFMINFRADRVRQLLRSFVDPAFFHFPREQIITFGATLGMTNYGDGLDKWVSALFPPHDLRHVMGDILADHGKTQLRLAETEKYAHVTYFFNGGRETPFTGESRHVIPSPKVSTYDLCPEMSARAVTSTLIEAIKSGEFDFILVNFANPDMVGHTGVPSAIQKAVEEIDTCLGDIEKAVIDTQSTMIVTADHGNVEQIHDHGTGQAHTAHTLNPVPFIIVHPDKPYTLKKGSLIDVAPTMLQLMGIATPAAMTGRSLLS